MKNLKNFGKVLTKNELKIIVAGNLPSGDHPCWDDYDPISCFAQEDASQYDTDSPAQCISAYPLGHPLYDDCPGPKIIKIPLP